MAASQGARLVQPTEHSEPRLLERWPTFIGREKEAACSTVALIVAEMGPWCNSILAA
jgi:hypothetical protein